MKKLICYILALAMAAALLPLAPAPQAQASSGKPVWKVAWIEVPEVNVWVGSELRNITLFRPGHRQEFIDSADLFKWYIEHYTNQAVEVQIDHITVEEAPTYTSNSSNRIEVRLYPSSNMVMKNITKDTNDVRLDEYDSRIAFWPFGGGGANNSPNGSNAYGLASSSGDVYMEVPPYVGNPNTHGLQNRWDFTHTAIHEFLHLTEYWFRDELGFPLPYDVPAGFGVISSGDRNALHNRSTFYNYLVNSYEMRERLLLFSDWYFLLPEDKFWFEDWLGYRIPDPLNPRRMLGVPPEAWQYTPTNGRRPTAIMGIVLVPSRLKGTEEYSVGTGYIDLNNETITLPSDYTVAAYSVDGGKKWKKGALPTDAKFSKLLDKSLELWVTDKWNAKDIKGCINTAEKKGVAKDATVITFPKIDPRPKKNTEKLRPFFASETWTLKTKDGIAAKLAYEWADTTDKKTPDGEWQPLPDGGFDIQSGKAKTTYLFRTPPIANGSKYVPASKMFKLTPANLGKAPTYKIKTNTKTSKDTIKLKANDWYQLNDATPVKVTAARDLDVTAMSGTLSVWKGETGKKPRSEKKEFGL
ncbi:MAG: hypothetical protein LBI19_07720 [Oscillospiraceae bacterium]|jgi:hypothetical protein|nr:hypothetical protein [Oscillospiraceae bacterium]